MLSPEVSSSLVFFSAQVGQSPFTDERITQTRLKLNEIYLGYSYQCISKPMNKHKSSIITNVACVTLRVSSTCIIHSLRPSPVIDSVTGCASSIFFPFLAINVLEVLIFVTTRIIFWCRCSSTHCLLCCWVAWSLAVDEIRGE